MRARSRAREGGEPEAAGRVLERCERLEGLLDGIAA
jgi:hypothetical protein